MTVREGKKMTHENPIPADQLEGMALDLLISAREGIRKATESKQDVTVAIDLLKRAKDSMVAQDYDGAMVLARRANESIGKDLERSAPEDGKNEASGYGTSSSSDRRGNEETDLDFIVEILEIVSTVIDKARQAGLDVTRAEELEDQALDAWNKKDIDTVVAISHNIREEMYSLQRNIAIIDEVEENETVSESKKRGIHEVLDTIRKIQERLSKIKVEGVDISSAEEVFQRVDDLLKQRKFTEAAQMAKRAEQMALSASGEEPLDDITSKDMGAETISSQVKKDTPGFKSSISPLTGKESTQELNRKAIMAIRAASQAIENARRQGIDTSTAEEAFRDAENALIKKDFAKLMNRTADAERFAFEAQNR